MTVTSQNLARQRRPQILWADDDEFLIGSLAGMLEIYGISVRRVLNAADAMKEFGGNPESFDMAVLDIMMKDNGAFGDGITQNGLQTGLLLGSWLRERQPNLPIVGFTVRFDDPHVVQWFQHHRYRLFAKPIQQFTLIDYVKRRLADSKESPDLPRIFIVHGRDKIAYLELKNYLQNNLQLGNPIILHEQPSFGRTIIEKFEQEAEGVDLVFVLLTPDDILAPCGEANESIRTARQNVIFEMGYFFAKLQRSKGRVLLLYKRGVDLPTDISGVCYINISEGVEAAGEKIRRELRDWI